jgi:hypothetical protein
MVWKDRAMWPRVNPGCVLHFRADLLPEAGDGVLIQDHIGGLHFRRYVVGGSGRWIGKPESDCFATLDSETDRVRVVAVLIGIEGRWADVTRNTYRAEVCNA